MNTIDFQNYLSWTYFGKDAFDKDEFDRMNQLLEGVTRFIDIGASHGIYSFHANNFLSDTDIICIEADPERFEILKANVAKWAEGSTNRFECILAAASDEQDRKDQPEIPFYTTGTQISGGLFPVGERSDGYKPTTIPLVCIDDFFEEGSNTFIKIDVEGSEMRVLKGATQHIKKRNTKII